MEMVSKDAKDPEFRKQMMYVKPETKTFINAMIKSFEIIDLQEKPVDYRSQFLKLMSTHDHYDIEEHKKGDALHMTKCHDHHNETVTPTKHKMETKASVNLKDNFKNRM